MRHGRKFNHLSRKAGHRKALLMNLSQALIRHKRINTTLAKAKALRGYIEPLVTKAKQNTTHARRVAFSYLQDKEAVNELFSTVREKVADRPGGYVRVIRTGFRPGDGAETAMIEFVDFNETYVSPGKASKQAPTRKRTRRAGRGKGKSAVAPATAKVAKTSSSEEE